MKKNLLTVLLLTTINIFSFAGGGWATSAVSLTKDNGTAYDYKLNDEGWTDGSWGENSEFDLFDFGVPSSLILNGGSGNAWTDDTPGYTTESFILYYRAYLTSGEAGVWNSIALDNLAYVIGNNKIYDKSNADIDILELVGNTDGNYTLEIVMTKNQFYSGGSWNSMVPGGQATAYNSLTAGYKATFEISSTTTSPATQASAIVFSSVGTTSMTIGWTNGDGSKRAVFMKEGSGTITNPTDNTTYTASANWASKGTQLGTSGYYCVYNGSSNTVDISGLSHSTTYYVQVFEYNGLSLDEKYNITTATDNPKAQTTAQYPVHITATLGVTSGNYNTLKAAFDAINAGTHKGVITITINTNTTETSSAVLYNSGYHPVMAIGSSYTSVTIYPSVSGLSISGDLATPLIDLNGADNVTIDGRVNAAGGAKDLVITNTSTSSTPGTSTIRFINDASTNTVKYCTIKGSQMVPNGLTPPITGSGIILFSTGTSSGNDGNTIDNNNITNSADDNRPVNAIFSLGTSTAENSNNTISNNNIFDFLNRGAASTGITLSSFTTGCTINDNSFFETTSFGPTSDAYYNVIYIINEGINFTVSNNYIGGNAASCVGTWTKTNTGNNVFTGIALTAGTATPSNIQGNTISGFDWSNFSQAAWYGISILGGAANIGTLTGNTIGNSTGTGSISFANAAFGLYLAGIYSSSSGAVAIQNNTIGSITTSNASANSTDFYGMILAGSGTTTVINNTIGSTTTENSILASSASTSADQSVFGINSLCTGSVTISGNTISKLTNGTTNATVGSIGTINGIMVSDGINTITGNTVRDLSIANANNLTTSSASVIGISQTSTSAGQTISGNTIYNLSNTNSTSVTPLVTGIYYSGGTNGTNLVSKNFIHSLSVSSSNYGAGIKGMQIDAGTTTFANNIITLGSNLNSDYSVNGIYEFCPAANNLSFYYNTVYLGGNAGVGAQMTHAFISISSDNIKKIQNNIIVNARTGTTLKRQCAIRLQSDLSLPGLTIDNNDYYAPNTGGVIGKRGPSTTYTTLAAWQGFTSQDANSKSADPVFASAGGTLAANYLPSETSLIAATGTGITTDYNGTTRSTSFPSMSAYEYSVNASAPTTQASAIVFSAVGTTQMTVGWTNGNGVKRTVFVKEGAGAVTNPTDNTTYTASADWTSKGTQLGTSGYYCVYNGSSNTVDLTGLSHSTSYYVQVFEYNGPALGEKYITTTATDNPNNQATNEAFFTDGTNYYSSWSSMIAGVSAGSSVTLLSAYNCNAGAIVSNSFTLNLNGFSLTNTGSYTTEIADGKSFNLKNTGVGGTFNGLLSFDGSTSILGLFSENVFGAGFTISATSAASGILQIGDGTTALNQTYTTGDAKFNGKISKILIKNSSTLIMNPLSD